MVANTRDELLRQLCADLRLMWRQAGGPSLRTLSGQVGLGKSQVGAILTGDIRTLPDWDVVKALVESFRRYAEQHGRMTAISLRTGVDAFWRPRYGVLEHAFRRAGRAPSGGPDRDPAPGGAVVPRQLPPAVPHFTGRTPELKMLTGLVNRVDSRTIVITAIDGMAGIGKTALAVSWAHRVARRFPDGQLYVNLRGFDPTGAVVGPGDALCTLLDALQVPPQRIPAVLDAQVGLYRSVLADKRVLVVLDNARDAEQVRPLLPGSPGCMVVVTSRNRLSSLIAAEGAHPLTLGLLATADARKLLASRLGTTRVDADAGAVDAIIARCARLPLALSIVAARAATVPHLPLDALATQLDEAQGDLAALAGWDRATDLRTAFSWSYRALHPDAARLFRLLGVHPGPDVSAPAAASLTGLPLRQIRPLLAELTRANLVTERTAGRYTLHDLLRAYAADLAGTTDSDGERHAARHRLLDHYVHTANTADKLLDPHRDVLPLGPPWRGAVPERPADHAEALDWFVAEHQVLLTAIAHAVGTGLDRHVVQLAWTVAVFLQRRGHWHELVAVQRLALDAARRLGDRHGQAGAHRLLARAYAWLSRLADAHTELRRALELYADLGDRVGEAHTHQGLSWVAQLRDRAEEAAGHDRRAAELYQAAGHRVGHARALNALGWHLAVLGDHRAALASCQRALALLQELGERNAEAQTWHSLGYSHRHLGDHDQAVACYRRALEIFRELGDRYNEGDTLMHLGDTMDAVGDPDRARVAWRDALAILDELGHPGAAEVRARLEELV